MRTLKRSSRDRLYDVMETTSLWVLVSIFGGLLAAFLFVLASIAFGVFDPATEGAPLVGSDGKTYTYVTFDVPHGGENITCVSVKGHGVDSFTCTP